MLIIQDSTRRCKVHRHIFIVQRLYQFHAEQIRYRARILYYRISTLYYIYNIYTDRENIKVNCDSIDWCIDSVYEQKDDYFNKSRLTSGFKVDSISLLAYKEDIIPFINDNNLECEIK